MKVGLLRKSGGRTREKTARACSWNRNSSTERATRSRLEDEGGRAEKATRNMGGVTRGAERHIRRRC